jgi:hypothetical protein
MGIFFDIFVPLVLAIGTIRMAYLGVQVTMYPPNDTAYKRRLRMEFCI